MKNKQNSAFKIKRKSTKKLRTNAGSNENVQWGILNKTLCQKQFDLVKHVGGSAALRLNETCLDVQRPNVKS